MLSSGGGFGTACRPRPQHRSTEYLPLPVLIALSALHNSGRGSLIPTRRPAIWMPCELTYVIGSALRHFFSDGAGRSPREVPTDEPGAVRIARGSTSCLLDGADGRCVAGRGSSPRGKR